MARSNLRIDWDSKPGFPEAPDYPEPYGSAIKAIIDDVREESADVESYTLNYSSNLIRVHRMKTWN